MPEGDSGAGANETPPASTGGAGAEGQNGVNGTGAGAGGHEAGPATLDEAKATLASTQQQLAAANRESAERRVKLKEYEDAEAERVKQGMSELEQRDARIKELETENGDLKSTISVAEFSGKASAAAKSLGFRNPDIATNLISESTRAKLTVDGKLDEEGLSKALADILKSDPYLGSGGGGGDGGGGRGQAATGQSMTDRIRSAAGKN